MRVSAEHGDPIEQQEREEEEARGVWMLLPTDLLLLVFARLTAVDLVSAGAVCVSWRKALRTKGRLPPRTIFPWHMIHGIGISLHTPPAQDCIFVDPSARRSYKILLPGPDQSRMRKIGRSDDGFLVYEDMDSHRLSMVNPITGAVVSFLPLPTSRYHDHGNALVVSTGTGYAVVRHGDLSLSSFFADAGNLEAWRGVSLILDGVAIRELHAHGNKLCGLFFHFGGDDHSYRFFTCDLDDITDLRLKVWAFKVPPHPCWSPADLEASHPGRGECLASSRDRWYTEHHPVVLPNGDLIVVCRTFMYPRETIGLMVYKMPADHLHGEAEIVASIGNYALFVDGYSTIVVSTLESPELEPSAIYFNDSQCFLLREGGKGWSSRDIIYLFDMEAHLYPVSNIFWFVPVF